MIRGVIDLDQHDPYKIKSDFTFPSAREVNTLANNKSATGLDTSMKELASLILEAANNGLFRIEVTSAKIAEWHENTLRSVKTKGYKVEWNQMDDTYVISWYTEEVL
jgi:hypothetical protein